MRITHGWNCYPRLKLLTRPVQGTGGLSLNAWDAGGKKVVHVWSVCPRSGSERGDLSGHVGKGNEAPRSSLIGLRGISSGARLTMRARDLCGSIYHSYTPPVRQLGSYSSSSSGRSSRERIGGPFFVLFEWPTFLGVRELCLTGSYRPLFISDHERACLSPCRIWPTQSLAKS